MWKKNLLIAVVIILLLAPVVLLLVTSQRSKNTAPTEQYTNGKPVDKFTQKTTVDYMLYGRFLKVDSEDAAGIHGVFEIHTPTGRTQVPVLLQKQEDTYYFVYYSPKNFDTINLVGRVDGATVHTVAIDKGQFVQLHLKFDPSLLYEEDKKLMQSLDTLNTGSWSPPPGAVLIATAVGVLAPAPTSY